MDDSAESTREERRDPDLLVPTERRRAVQDASLVVGERLYLCSDRGSLACYEAKTGKILYEEKLKTHADLKGNVGFSASIVYADDKIYATSEKGDVVVVKSGPEFSMVSKNALGETCMATPAISKGVLFFRTRDHVIAVGN